MLAVVEELPIIDAEIVEDDDSVIEWDDEEIVWEDDEPPQDRHAIRPEVPRQAPSGYLATPIGDLNANTHHPRAWKSGGFGG